MHVVSDCLAGVDDDLTNSCSSNTIHLYYRFYLLQNTHTHTRLTALCPGLPGWAGTRKVKPMWILLKQETVSGSGISWAICKSASRSRQITTPAPHCSVFTDRVPFLPPNQQTNRVKALLSWTISSANGDIGVYGHWCAVSRQVYMYSAASC